MKDTLSKYFTWKEVTASDTAAKFKLDNSVPSNLVDTVKQTARKMDAIRILLGFPVTVTSWYRSPKVNWNVGGSKTSQHMQGCAVDFRCAGFGSPYSICKFLEDKVVDLGIDQLIYEVSWVHISFSDKPRNQVLTYCKGHYTKGIVLCGK